MHCTVEEIGPLRRRLDLRVEPEELAEREESLLQRYSRKANLKGFRPGRVPAGLMRKRFGRQVHAEAVDALIREGLQQGIEEHQLRPLGPVEEEESSHEDGIVHRVAFDVHPPIDLPEPAAITLTQNDTTVSDQEVAEHLLDIRKRAGSLEELGADAELQADDIVTLSGEVAVGDETVREVHDLRHIIGAYPLFGKTPEEVVALCADVAPGGELTFTTVLPDDFQPAERAGAEARVSLSVQTAQRRIPAEVDADFLRQVGVADEEQLKERIREVLGERKEQEATSAQQNELLDALQELTDFDLPEHFLAQAGQQQIEHERRLAGSRAGEDEPEEVDEDAVRAQVERELRRSLLLEAVAVRYEVQVEQRDIEQQIAMAAYQSGRKFEDVARELRESGRLTDVAQEIRHGKAINLLLERVRAEGDTRAAEGADGEAPTDEVAAAPEPKKATKKKAAKKKAAKKKTVKKKTAKKKTVKKAEPDAPAEDTTGA